MKIFLQFGSYQALFVFPQNLFYRVKIIPEKAKKDRWEELLEKTASHAQNGNFTKDDEFAFFDSADDGNDRVFVNERELVVVSENRQYHDDLLKKIYDKEFTPKPDETVRMIQKPPRKSIEGRNSLDRKRTTSSTYSSRNSMKFDD